MERRRAQRNFNELHPLQNSAMSSEVITFKLRRCTAGLIVTEPQARYQCRQCREFKRDIKQRRTFESSGQLQ